MKKSEFLSLIAVFVNIVLLVIKGYIFFLSGSLAVLSDGFNSLLDIISSLAIYFAVRISSKKADYDHPFGHRRAEPIAGLIVAVLASILGFEIIKDSILSFFKHSSITFTRYTLILLGFSILLKLALSVVFYIISKKVNSPALKASAVDYRNDVLVSVSVLVGSISVFKGYYIADSIVALFVGGFIIYSGIKIGLENIDFLMGRRPSDEIIDRLKKIALSIEGVKALNDVRAHYLGAYIQLEVHIEVDKELSTEESHRIAKEVQKALLEDEAVDYAFIHVDPT